MRDLEPYLTGERSGKVVGITFDDGYRNNLVHALPVLQRLGFTATCYCVSGLIGKTNEWDAGKVATSPLMSAADWRSWLHAGMDVGSHTLTHSRLTQIRPDVAYCEISESRSQLQDQLGCDVRHFCYPYGAFGDEHCQMVRDAGYVSATTTQRGRVILGDDPFRYKRIMVARAVTLPLFTLKIATSYEDRKS